MQHGLEVVQLPRPSYRGDFRQISATIHGAPPSHSNVSRWRSASSLQHQLAEPDRYGLGALCSADDGF